MTPAAALISARRAAVVAAIDAAGSAAAIELLNAGGSVLVSIPLAYPCGSVDSTGVQLATTEYGQIIATGDAANAKIVDGSGTLIAYLTTGIAGDSPTPDIVLTNMRLNAGSFLRLVSPRINCD